MTLFLFVVFCTLFIYYLFLVKMNGFLIKKGEETAVC